MSVHRLAPPPLSNVSLYIINMTAASQSIVVYEASHWFGRPILGGAIKSADLTRVRNKPHKAWLAPYRLPKTMMQ